jgi:hypothetical protein
MARNKKMGNTGEISKPKSPAKKKEEIKNPDQIISEITEDTKVLKGIISRFSKPLTKDDSE